MKKAPFHLTSLIALCILLTGARAAQAQIFPYDLPEQAYLVKDIYPGSAQSFPFAFQSLNGKAFFTAYSPAFGREIWSSDGTETGTQQLKDIQPGPTGGVPGAFWGFAKLNNRFYFYADDGIDGLEFWQTDGTEAGTKHIAGILQTGVYNPGRLDIALGYIFFRATDASGIHLWRTDGTAEGTVKITSQAINNSYCPDSVTTKGAEFQGKYYFIASEGERGCAIWKTSGFPDQTQRVENSASNPYFYQIENMTVVGNILFFTAWEDYYNYGIELWAVDGISGQTRLVKDIYPENYASSHPEMLTVFQDKVYFVATDLSGNKLWRSDGTVVGTVPIPASVGHPEFNFPGGMTVFGNWLIFKAEGLEVGSELFKSDGDQVFLVKDIVQDSCSVDCGSRPGTFTVFNNQMLFVANANSLYPQDRELWRTDGTETGTIRLTDICPGNCSADPYRLFRQGNHVFFTADDSLNGLELWAYKPPLKEMFIPLILR